jgi:uncharacterized flavoprotein (TIGR03862 family)
MPPFSAQANAHVAIIGAGPAGLMAAEMLSAAGLRVNVFDGMPSVGRKFLLAGRGGLNLTHSEGLDQPERLIARYESASTWLAPMLKAFGAQQLRKWAAGLGIETFVGSSGRVFPTSMKAAPLLRAWLHRLQGTRPSADENSPTVPVQFHVRHHWTGWSDAGHCVFDTPTGLVESPASAVVLALGGGSWPRLGSNGAWVQMLAECGVSIAPLQAANCGFNVLKPWSDLFASRFAGQPFKSVRLSVYPPKHSPQAEHDPQAPLFQRKGEFVATTSGVEGSLIYAASRLLREQINAVGSATLVLDLLPDWSAERVLAELQHPRGSRSLSNHLKSRLGLDGIKANLLFEYLSKAQWQDPQALAAAIKSLPLALKQTRPMAEAISTAGGVRQQSLTEHLMLKALPGVFCAGEMLDWEAPTGGYLLTACMASGRWAGLGVLLHLAKT